MLSNDIDIDDDGLTIAKIAAGPKHGTASLFEDSTAVTYTPTKDYNGADSLQYVLRDGNGGLDTATVAITVNAVNDAPVIATVEEDTLYYTENDGAVSISSTLTIEDVDASATMNAATVFLDDAVAGQDSLVFANQNGITGTFDGSTLTLSGEATAGQYQTALRSVRYINTSDNPKHPHAVASGGSTKCSRCTNRNNPTGTTAQTVNTIRPAP